MSQRTIVVVYACWRRLPSPVRDDEWLYEFWIVTEMRPVGPEEVDPEPVLHTKRVDNAERPGECLRKASAKSAANSIEGAIWRVWQTSNDLTLVQAINFLIGVSDSLHGAVKSSLESLADTARVPTSINLVGADVMATLLTEPIAEPIEDLEHGLELAGILFGLVTGMQPLVMTCAKYLIHDEINSTLAKLLNDALGAAFKSLGSAFGIEARNVETAADDLAIDNMSVEQAALLKRRLDAAENGPRVLPVSPAYGEDTSVSEAVTAITPFDA